MVFLPQACDYGKLVEFLGAVKSKDVTFITVHGARHEIFRCPQRGVVIADMVKWVLSRRP